MSNKQAGQRQQNKPKQKQQGGGMSKEQQLLLQLGREYKKILDVQLEQRQIALDLEQQRIDAVAQARRDKIAGRKRRNDAFWENVPKMAAGFFVIVAALSAIF